MKQISNELNISSWFIRKMFRKFNISVRINRNPTGNKGGHYFTQDRDQDTAQ